MEFQKHDSAGPGGYVYTVRPNHVVELANELMLRIWCKPMKDVMYRPIFEGLPDARDQGLEKLLDDVYATGVTFTASERPVHLLREGKPDIVYQNFVYEPYRDGNGTILGVLATSVDVTAQVLARQQIEQTVAERTASLAEANRQLQRSNNDLAQFAQIASHDLQEPLRKIAIYSDRLEAAASRLNTRENEYVEKIKTSASRMRALVKDLLAFAEAAPMNIDAAVSVSLNEVVAEVLEEFELLIEQKNAVVTVGKLPVVTGLRVQMLQLMSNLLSNALKYSRKGVAPVITINAVTGKGGMELSPALKANADYHIITVSDNGIGFAPESAGKVFDIFQRLVSRKEYEGTGIGLSLCRKIVHNHSGDIIASSAPDRGSTFTVFLPVNNL